MIVLFSKAEEMYSLIMQEISQSFAEQDLERKKILPYTNFSNLFHCRRLFASSEASGTGHY